jgi:hypothetical protein
MAAIWLARGADVLKFVPHNVNVSYSDGRFTGRDDRCDVCDMLTYDWHEWKGRHKHVVSRNVYLNSVRLLQYIRYKSTGRKKNI